MATFKWFKLSEHSCLQCSLSDEKEAHTQLANEHRQWQKKFQEDSERLREEKVKAMARASELEQRLKQAKQAKEAESLKTVRELTALEQKQEVREKELAYRLEGSEEAHQKSIQELRNLLAAQHRVGARYNLASMCCLFKLFPLYTSRWREESKTLAQKSEQNITDLKVELVRYRNRSTELTRQLNLLKHEREEMSKQLQQAVTAKSSLQLRLKDAEIQAEMGADQITQLLSREKHLLHERRELHRQLDMVKLQTSRNNR